jgi:hypothetical protein
MQHCRVTSFVSSAIVVGGSFLVAVPVKHLYPRSHNATNPFSCAHDRVAVGSLLQNCRCNFLFWAHTFCEACLGSVSPVSAQGRLSITVLRTIIYLPINASATSTSTTPSRFEIAITVNTFFCKLLLDDIVNHRLSLLIQR